MKSRCERCWLRNYAERKPNALLSRIWRWHTGWCPGWKAYQKELAEKGNAMTLTSKGPITAADKQKDKQKQQNRSGHPRKGRQVDSSISSVHRPPHPQREQARS